MAGDECRAAPVVCNSAAAEDLPTSSPPAELSPAPSAVVAACSPTTAFASAGASPLASGGGPNSPGCLDEGAQLLQQYRAYCFEATQWTAEVRCFFVAALRGARSAVCCARFRQFVLWRALWRLHSAQPGLRARMTDAQLLDDLIKKLCVEEDEQVELRKVHADGSRIAALVGCAQDEMLWLLLMNACPAHFSLRKLRELASPAARTTWDDLETSQRHSLWVTLMGHKSAVDLLSAVDRLGRSSAPPASMLARAACSLAAAVLAHDHCSALETGARECEGGSSGHRPAQ
jgi:hypothetical protein